MQEQFPDQELPRDVKIFHVTVKEGIERFIIIALGNRHIPSYVVAIKTYESAATFCNQLSFRIPKQLPKLSLASFFRDICSWKKENSRAEELNLQKLVAEILNAEEKLKENKVQ